MNSFSKLALSAALGASALVGLHGSALALTTINGSVCRVNGDSGTAGLQSYATGVTNMTAGVLGVICPIVRTIPAFPGKTYDVWVDGHTGTGPGFCSLYSVRDLDGSPIIAQRKEFNGPFHEKFTLPAVHVPTWSSQAMFCALSPKGKIYDVEPVQ